MAKNRRKNNKVKKNTKTVNTTKGTNPVPANEMPVLEVAEGNYVAETKGEKGNQSTVVTKVPTNEVVDNSTKVEEVSNEDSAPCEGKPCENIATNTTESGSPCDTEHKESKKEIEAEARSNKSSKKDDSSTERENETGEDTSSVETQLENTSDTEASKPTVDITDSSDSTTDKVEQKDEPKSLNALNDNEVPYWVEGFVRGGWLRSHGSVDHPNGGKIELHANHGFDKNGRTIEIQASDVPRPNTKGMTRQEVKEAYAEFHSKVSEERERRAKTLIEVYKSHAKLLPSFLPMHLKKVHCWNKEKNKDLNIVGTLVGLQGGREPYTVLIDGHDKDGNPKKIRRGFRFVSTDLPDGEEVSQETKLESATDVEERVKTKLLEDKSSLDLVFPMGYDTAIKNLGSGKNHHTILVWNSEGTQLSFFASPVLNDEGKYQWVSIEQTHGGYIRIHNDAIKMSGSVQELLRVTTLINQEHIDNLLVVSIPEDDYGQMTMFMETLGLGAIKGINDGEGQKEQ